LQIFLRAMTCAEMGSIPQWEYIAALLVLPQFRRDGWGSALAE
jgi:hypothetical protein